MTDPYRLLGIAPGATPNEIRTARRRLAKQLHPDTVVDTRQRDLAQAQMASVNEAADAALAVATSVSSSAAPRKAEPGRRPRQQDKPDGYWGTGDEPTATFRIGGVDLRAGYELVMLGLANLGDPKDVDSPLVIEAQVLDPVPCFARAVLEEEGDGIRCTLETAPMEGSRLTPPAPVILLNRLLQELRTLSH